MAFSKQKPCFVLPQAVFHTAVTASVGTDRPASSGKVSGGQTHINESANEAPVMLTNGYEDMFNEIASKWYGEPPRSEPQQNQQDIKSPINDLGLVYLNNQQV